MEEKIIKTKNMRIKPKKTFTQKSSIILVIIIVLIACIFTAFFFYVRHSIIKDGSKIENNFINGSINYSAPTQNEKDEGNRQKKEATENRLGSDRVPVNSKALDISFTSVNKYDQKIRIKSLVTEAVTGSCLLSISKNGGGASKTYSSDLQPLASTSTCTGFEIPIEDIGVGNWNIILRATSSEGKTGEAISDFKAE